MMTPENTQTTEMTSSPELQNLPENVLRAANVWLSFSDLERDQLTATLDLISKLPHDVVKDIVINVRTGPYAPFCPYCGRG